MVEWRKAEQLFQEPRIASRAKLVLGESQEQPGASQRTPAQRPRGVGELSQNTIKRNYGWESAGESRNLG